MLWHIIEEGRFVLAYQISIKGYKKNTYFKIQDNVITTVARGRPVLDSLYGGNQSHPQSGSKALSLL